MRVRLDWETRYKWLKAYKQRNGHCNVPRTDDKLGRWVQNQRSLYRQGKLRVERINKLEEIGFQFKLRNITIYCKAKYTKTFDDRFDEKLKQIESFIKKEGSGWIPRQYPEDKVLAEYANNLRRFFREGKLQEKRIKRLEAIRFVWKKTTKSKSDA